MKYGPSTTRQVIVFLRSPGWRFVAIFPFIYLVASHLIQNWIAGLLLGLSLLAFSLSSYYYGNTYFCLFSINFGTGVSREKNPYIFHFMVILYLLFSLLIIWMGVGQFLLPEDQHLMLDPITFSYNPLNP